MYPDKVAVVHEDRRYTYREFGERVNRLASALRAAGLRKGDRVAFICTEHPGAAGGAFRVPAWRACSVVLNYRLNARDTGFILAHSGARFVFVDREFEHLPPARGPAVRCASTTPARPATRTRRSWPEGRRSRCRASWAMRTSRSRSTTPRGRPGRPKGAVYHYRGAYLNALGEVIETRLTPESVYLWTLPMFHCNGWCFTWAVTAVGGRHVCLRKVEPGRVWELIGREGVTHYSGAPTVQASILDHPSARKLDHEDHHDGLRVAADPRSCSPG